MVSYIEGMEDKPTRVEDLFTDGLDFEPLTQLPKMGCNDDCLEAQAAEYAGGYMDGVRDCLYELHQAHELADAEGRNLTVGEVRKLLTILTMA